MQRISCNMRFGLVRQLLVTCFFTFIPYLLLLFHPFFLHSSFRLSNLESFDSVSSCDAVSRFSQSSHASSGVPRASSRLPCNMINISPFWLCYSLENVDASSGICIRSLILITNMGSFHFSLVNRFVCCLVW